jgi:hypothetical protein
MVTRKNDACIKLAFLRAPVITGMRWVRKKKVGIPLSLNCANSSGECQAVGVEQLIATHVNLATIGTVFLNSIL